LSLDFYKYCGALHLRKYGQSWFSTNIAVRYTFGNMGNRGFLQILRCAAPSEIWAIMVFYKYCGALHLRKCGQPWFSTNIAVLCTFENVGNRGFLQIFWVRCTILDT
jgi:hypothetical protein